MQTDCPISKVLKKPELARRIIDWLVKFPEFGIKYESRGPIKSQCLVDFIWRCQSHEVVTSLSIGHMRPT